jgi:nicotinamide-nucleotide amidase
VSVRAGIVVTGTEVLSGHVTDRNGPWVSERLGELGVEVAHIVCVGDRPEDLGAALGFMASEEMDLVVTTGGLGPTADDLTAEAVARFAGREMVLDCGMEERIAEILRGFARRLRFDADALRDANRKQAMVPEGATTVDPAGTAPGLVVPADPFTVIVMPGPPGELHAMWDEAISKPAARAVLDRAEPFRTGTLRLFGMPESELAKTLREVESEVDLEPLEITTCLRGGELVVDVRYRDGGDTAWERLRVAIRERHGRFLYSDDGTTLGEQLAALLAGKRVAVGESCTGGLVAKLLTDRPGSSGYFAGGVVAYSDDAKQRLLDVDPKLIASDGAVSPAVAEAMADGALARFEADVACAVTGIAGPDGGSEEKPVGYVCFCVKAADGAKIARDPVIPGTDRGTIRDRSAMVALHLLRRLLRGEDFPL